MSEQKAHKPTKKKLKDSRKEGKVLRAPMISQLFSMLMVILTLFVMCRYLWFKNKMLLEWSLEEALSNPAMALREAMIATLVIIAGPLLIGSLSGILVQSWVTGVTFEWSILLPKGSRFGQGLKQILRGLKQSWETLAKIVLFSLISWWVLSRFIADFENMYSLEASVVLELAYVHARNCVVFLLVGFAAFSYAEYLLRQKEFYKDLSMSDQDIRQEHKNDEGDPHIKAQRKALHQEVLSQELVERVRKAKVIIVKRNNVATPTVTDS